MTRLSGSGRAYRRPHRWMSLCGFGLLSGIAHSHYGRAAQGHPVAHRNRKPSAVREKAARHRCSFHARGAFFAGFQTSSGSRSPERNVSERHHSQHTSPSLSRSPSLANEDSHRLTGPSSSRLASTRAASRLFVTASLAMNTSRPPGRPAGYLSRCRPRQSSAAVSSH